MRNKMIAIQNLNKTIRFQAITLVLIRNSLHYAVLADG